MFYSIGEALIDFIPSRTECQLKDVESFRRVAGGAPTNVSAVLSLLGQKSGVITKLGDDAFGDYIVETLQKVNVDTKLVLRTDKANTALAFVSLKKDGNRDFSFYRKPSADMLLESEELDKNWFKDCKALHFCSVDLIECPMKYAHKTAIDFAQQNGALISFDPNVRLPLWSDREACKKVINEFIPYADILKISDEELEFITGEADLKSATRKLFVGKVTCLLYTKGKDGAELHLKDGRSFTVAGLNVKAIDTTGAGDAFIGAFLYELISNGITKLSEDLSNDFCQKALEFANKYAAITATQPGAIDSYVTKEEFAKASNSLNL